MSKIQLVIEIDEEIYSKIVNIYEYSFITLTKEQLERLDGAIRRGTPLPKGHGKLKDVDALYKSSRLCHTEEDGTACVEWREINDAPTIIEADGGLI